MKTETQHSIEQLKKATDRIQKEIEEVTEREHELKNVGSIKTLSHDLVDSKVRRMPQALSCGRLKRASSTPQILEPNISVTPTNSPATTPTTPFAPRMTNGVSITNSPINGSTIRTINKSTAQPLRFASAPGQRGLMHRFIATRGRIYTRSVSEAGPTISLNPESIRALNRSIELRGVLDNAESEQRTPPTRKGFVPVEKKIQRELSEMREREDELRLMRSQMLAKSQPNLVDIVNSDNYSDIYESGGSMRSGTSTNTLNEDEPEKENKDRHKPHPRRRSNLIAQWENLIAAKKEASEKGVENGNTV